MPTPWQRDLETDGRKFEQWLRKQLPDATDIAMSPLVSPTSSGFSNETLLFDLDYRLGGEAVREKLVVRIQPIGYQVFPAYDLGLQFRTMQLLAPTPVPVPTMRWLEENDTSIFGAPFYVMVQVDGRVPSDNPPYHVDGWLAEASPEERAQVWWGGIESLAAIQRLDPFEIGFGFLDQRKPGQSPLDVQFEQYRRYYEWAARGKPQPTVDAAWQWLLANKPSDEPTCLQWGDARIGNIIFEGTRPAAVIDWEMVTLGSPEADLGWTIFLDRHHSEGLERERLEGFPSYEATVDRYQELTGHTVKHLRFYQAWCGFRFGVIMMRLAQQMVHYEIMDEEAGYAFETNNTVTRLLAKVLELPPPGESAGAGGGFGPQD